MPIFNSFQKIIIIRKIFHIEAIIKGLFLLSKLKQLLDTLVLIMYLFIYSFGVCLFVPLFRSQVPYFVPDTPAARADLAAQYTTVSRLDQGECFTLPR